MSESKTTSLYDFHLSKNAKIIDFAGWSMPFSYDGTLKEHHYVRESAGYFDVSHMGRLRLNYSQIDDINYLICSDLKNISNSKALYYIFISEEGTAIDDVIFWKFNDPAGLPNLFKPCRTQSILRKTTNIEPEISKNPKSLHD